MWLRSNLGVYRDGLKPWLQNISAPLPFFSRVLLLYDGLYLFCSVVSRLLRSLSL
jgi:hypothetical protein